MLVLTRKLQQQIKIGDQITVTILRVKGSTVRVGVQAPREVRVVRGELPKQPVATSAEPADESTMEPADESTMGPVEESTIIEFRVPAAALAELEAMNENTPADEAPAPAAHLPLRRMRDRFGSGPLKQVIASAALAK